MQMKVAYSRSLGLLKQGKGNLKVESFVHNLGFWLSSSRIKDILGFLLHSTFYESMGNPDLYNKGDHPKGIKGQLDTFDWPREPRNLCFEMWWGIAASPCQMALSYVD